MFFSFDMKYIVKTTQYDEIIGLQLILSKYRDYLAANPHSLMTKIIGAHSITMYGKIIYFIVQQNIFPASENLSERYDLKGSWVNRYTNAGKNLSLRYFFIFFYILHLFIIYFFENIIFLLIVKDIKIKNLMIHHHFIKIMI